MRLLHSSMLLLHVCGIGNLRHLLQTMYHQLRILITTCGVSPTYHNKHVVSTIHHTGYYCLPPFKLCRRESVTRLCSVTTHSIINFFPHSTTSKNRLVIAHCLLVAMGQESRAYLTVWKHKLQFYEHNSVYMVNSYTNYFGKLQRCKKNQRQSIQQRKHTVYSGTPLRQTTWSHNFCPLQQGVLYGGVLLIKIPDEIPCT